MLERWRRIGFRDMASWPVFWVTLLGNALLPGLLTSQLTGLTWGNRLIITAVTQVVVWTVILGGWLLSERFGSCAWAVVITALVAAGLRGVVIGALLPVLDIGTSSPGLLRVLTSMATMGFLILAATASVAGSREYRAECDRLSSRRQELLTARREARRLSDVEEDRFSAEVANSLRAAIAEVSGLGRLDAAQRLRAIGDEHVRPLAHLLVRSLREGSDADAPAAIPGSAPPAAFSAILLTTLHPQDIRPLPIAVACAFLPLPAAITRFGPTLGLVVCVVVFLSILLSASAARALLTPLTRPGQGSGALMLIPALVLMTLAFALPFGLMTSTPIVTAILAGGAVLTVVTLILAVGHAFAERRDQILRQLADENSDLAWQIARTNGVRWARQRATARTLHGPIQSALAVAALRLEGSARDAGDSAASTTETAEWLDDVVARLASENPQTTSLAEHMALVGETWSGQCDSTVEWEGVGPDEIDADHVCAGIVSDLVIEGFSNSVRHGRADHVHVTVQRAGPRCIRVDVRDDGHSRVGDGTPGLGMAYLDDVTIRHSFTRDAGGGLMTADIPFVARHDAGT